MTEPKTPLDRLRAVLAARTSGPWKPVSGWIGEDGDQGHCAFGPATLSDSQEDEEEQAEADAKAMAAAVNVSDALIAVASEARIMVDTLDRVLDMTDQQLTVTVNGQRMRLDATAEVKQALAALDRAIKEQLP